MFILNSTPYLLEKNQLQAIFIANDNQQQLIPKFHYQVEGLESNFCAEKYTQLIFLVSR